MQPLPIAGKEVQELDTPRYFREKRTKDYLALVMVRPKGYTPNVDYECVVTAIQDVPSSLCISGVSNEFLEKNCVEIKFEDMSTEWRTAFTNYINQD